MHRRRVSPTSPPPQNPRPTENCGPWAKCLSPDAGTGSPATTVTRSSRSPKVLKKYPISPRNCTVDSRPNSTPNAGATRMPLAPAPPRSTNEYDADVPR